MRCIALMNQKGGVGKTTSTVNIGAAVAAAGQRVCLIDMDPQAHLSLHVGVDPDAISRTAYDLLIDPDVTAAETVINVRPNLDVIPAVVDLAAAETELASHPQRGELLKTKFAAIAGNYDYVLIDCPPSLGLLTLNALNLATEIFVPMQAQFLALQGVGKLLETVGIVCRSMNPDLRVTGVILCMHEGQTTLSREVVADLDAFFVAAREQDVPWRNCRVLQPAIRRNIKLAEAPSYGKTIFDYAPWCPGAIDYRLLAERLIKETQMFSPARKTAPTATANPMQSEVPAPAPSIPVAAQQHVEAAPIVETLPVSPAVSSPPPVVSSLPVSGSPAKLSPAVGRNVSTVSNGL